VTLHSPVYLLQTACFACVCSHVWMTDVYFKSTYLNLTSLHRASTTVAPPKECPTTAILHRSMEFCWPGDESRRIMNEKLYDSDPCQQIDNWVVMLDNDWNTTGKPDQWKHTRRFDLSWCNNHLQRCPVELRLQNILHRHSRVDFSEFIQSQNAFTRSLFHLRKTKRK